MLFSTLTIKLTYPEQVNNSKTGVHQADGCSREGEPLCW